MDTFWTNLLKLTAFDFGGRTPEFFVDPFDYLAPINPKAVGDVLDEIGGHYRVSLESHSLAWIDFSPGMTVYLEYYYVRIYHHIFHSEFARLHNSTSLQLSMKLASSCTSFFLSSLIQWA